MSYTVKPIDTVYNGHRFRSRTEARWAVFFDHLGAGYEYEVEGFELGAAGRYLPDFYFSRTGFKADDHGPSTGVWIEIKGPSPTPNEVRKLETLCERRGQYGYILAGSPNKVQVINVHKETGHYRPDEEGIEALIEHALWHVDDVSGRTHWRRSKREVSEAIKAAMSARFEFGETPQYGRKKA